MKILTYEQIDILHLSQKELHAWRVRGNIARMLRMYSLGITVLGECPLPASQTVQQLLIRRACLQDVPVQITMEINRPNVPLISLR